jgi:hypothetical protein
MYTTADNFRDPAAADKLCAVWGVHPNAWLTRRGQEHFTDIPPKALAAAAYRREGPEFKLMMGRAVMQARDVAAWWLALLRDPADGPQVRGVETTRERHGRLGRPPKVEQAAA